MPPPVYPCYLTPGIQLCVTKPVLLESECSMRQGHMGFLPTSSLPSSPSLGYIQPQPARQNKWRRTKGLCCGTNLQSTVILCGEGTNLGPTVGQSHHNVEIRIVYIHYCGSFSARCDTNVSLAILHINKVSGNQHILSTT